MTEINKYHKSIIYKIVSSDPSDTNIYVGSTTNLKKRKQYHESACNDENSKSYHLKVYQHVRANKGWANWEVIVIEKWPSDTKQELLTREGYWQGKLNATLNKVRNGRTYNQWRSDNKAIIAEKAKLYATENTENIAERMKLYREENFESLSEKQHERYEQNKETILEKQKVYYTDNKETRLEQMKLYREQNKDKIAEQRKVKQTCECGSIFLHRCKAQHERTIKHQTFINQ